MLKTINTTKYMRLDELIKYIFDKGIKDKSFTSNIPCEPYYHYRNTVFVHPDRTISLGLDKMNDITDRDLFRVEVEEEITPDTEFNLLIETYESWNDNEYETGEFPYEFGRIKDVITPNTKRIYTFIDGEPVIVWERDNQ